MVSYCSGPMTATYAASAVARSSLGPASGAGLGPGSGDTADTEQLLLASEPPQSGLGVSVLDPASAAPDPRPPLISGR